MGIQPTVFILNQTCLEIVDHLRGWIETLPITLHADHTLGMMTAEESDRAIKFADALVLPAWEPHLFPSAEHMARHSSVKVMAIAASGYEWCDLEAATRYGIVVANTPAREGIEVTADQTFALMLAVSRQIPYHHQMIQRGRIERSIGVSVWDKTLGIIGLGNVGKAVARRARGFDMRILATTRQPDDQFNRTWGVEIVPIEQLLRESDYVSLHVRLCDVTRGMIGADELALMKESAMLINAARRDLVDEQALVEAILTGRLAGAALDDPPVKGDSPLLTLRNVVFAPHLGNRAIEGMLAVLHLALEQVVDALNGRRPLHVLNPKVYDRR